MKYNSVEVDWISQWILSHLKNSDGWESTSSISAALTLHDGVTDSKVRRRLRKLRNAGLVSCEKEKRENVADANLYKSNPNALDELDGLSAPPSTSDQHVRDLEQKIEELQVENNRLKSDVCQLKSQFDTLNNMFTGRTERIAEMQDNQDYLMNFSEKVERHMLAAAELFDDKNVDFNSYLDKARKQIEQRQLKK